MLQLTCKYLSYTLATESRSNIVRIAALNRQDTNTESRTHLPLAKLIYATDEVDSGILVLHMVVRTGISGASL